MRALPSFSHAQFWLLAATLAGLLVTLFSFYPGCMYHDSYAQYIQVKTGEIYNHHPPVMVYVWRLADRLIEGAGGMFLFHTLLYWAAVSIIGGALFASATARIGFMLLYGLFPPLFIMLAQVGKDAAVLAALLFALAMILLYLRAKWLGWLALAFAALAYGSTARHNSFTSAIPFLFYMSHLLSLHPLLAPYVQRHVVGAKLLIMGVLSAAMLLFCYWVNYVHVNHIALWPSVAVWDMAAISVARDEMLLPDYVINNKNFDMQRLKTIFGETSNYETLCKRKDDVGREVLCREAWKLRKGGMREPGLKTEDLPRLRHDWLALIRDHWPEYLHHRLRIMGYVLGIIRPPYEFYPYFPTCEEARHYTNGDITYDFHTPFNHSWLNVQAFRFMAAVKDSFIFRAWIYLLLAAGLAAAYAAPQKTRGDYNHISCMLAVSGMFYVLPLFIATGAMDFRYNIWMVAATPLALIFALKNR